MNPDGGHFKRKYAGLKLSGNENFFDYFRTTIPTFEELLTNIAPRLQKRFVFRKPVDPMEMLGLTNRQEIKHTYHKSNCFFLFI